MNNVQLTHTEKVELFKKFMAQGYSVKQSLRMAKL